MAGKPTRASEVGARLLSKFPSATAAYIAQRCGLSISAVQKSAWWKSRLAAKRKYAK